MTTPTIDTLLRLVPDSPDLVLQSLSTGNASLASASDFSGYSLLHAAASYAKLDLLRTLVNTYNVSPNIKDSDGETPLFVAETEDVVRVLIEELGADADVVNDEGVSALENARVNMEEDGGTWGDVVRYLESRGAGQQSTNATLNGTSHPPSSLSHSSSADQNGRLRHPPPLPDGIRLTGMTAVPEGSAEELGEADPEFRRRIEELAAREDFETQEGQNELRKLVEDAIGGLGGDADQRNTRRRVD